MTLFFRRGQAHAVFALTVASTSAPTAAEIAAGTDLTKAITAMSGWETNLNRVNVPVLEYKQELQVDGPQQFQDAQITFLEDDGVGSDVDSVARQDAFDAMVEGTSGFLILSPAKSGAPVATDKVEVWTCKIGATNRQWTLDNEPARYIVQFAVTGAPEKNAVVA